MTSRNLLPCMLSSAAVLPHINFTVFYTFLWLILWEIKVVLTFFWIVILDKRTACPSIPANPAFDLILCQKWCYKSWANCTVFSSFSSLETVSEMWKFALFEMGFQDAKYSQNGIFLHHVVGNPLICSQNLIIS